MKKYLTLQNVLKAAGLLFGLVAFFLMFTKQIVLIVGSSKSYVAFGDALFDSDFGAVISFIGYLFILLGALAGCAVVFIPVDAKIKRYILLGVAALILLGAIFVFIEAGVVNGRAENNLGWNPGYRLTAGPVFAGILGVLAALCFAASEFVPDKKLA